jgi:septum formation inhibitor MinC
MMEFQIASFQADNNNFRHINEMRSEEISSFRDTLDKFRRDINNELQKGSGAMFEEIVMQQDRVRELGTQVYEMVRDCRQRFSILDKFDVRFTKIEKNNDELRETITELKKQIDDLKKNTKETDKNM